MARMVVRVRGPVKRQLRKLQRKTNDKGLAMRCRVVLLWGERLSREKIAEMAGCSVSWVDRVVRRFGHHGVAGLLDRREDNGQTKLDERFLATLYEIVDKQPTDFGYTRPTWTQELLAKVMEQQTGVKVHPGTICRGLKQIKARLGRPKPTVDCPWSKTAKTRRLAAIRRAIDAMGAKDAAVYLDEVDIHLNPKIGPDWMNYGKQKQIPTPGQNVKRYVCGALDERTGRLHHVAGVSKNSRLFIEMLEELLRVYPRAGTIHVVLDNFRIHSSKQVQAWMAQYGKRIALHFLPPYCPDDNRIERKWRDLHASVTRNHRRKTMEQLMADVEEWIASQNKASPSKRRKAA